jgi:hypothetical protein
VASLGLFPTFRGPPDVASCMDFSRPPSPESSLSIIAESSLAPWEPILQHSTQVVLYNPTNHALSVRPAVAAPETNVRPSLPRVPTHCPYCARPFSTADEEEHEDHSFRARDAPTSRAANYFQLLEIANETSSRPPSPPPDAERPPPGLADGVIRPRSYILVHFLTFMQRILQDILQRGSPSRNGSQWDCVPLPGQSITLVRSILTSVFLLACPGWQPSW